MISDEHRLKVLRDKERLWGLLEHSHHGTPAAGEANAATYVCDEKGCRGEAAAWVIEETGLTPLHTTFK